MKYLIKRLAFTLMVALAAVLAMIFPAQILQVGGFSTQTLIIPLLMLIMFGMGTTMSVADFKGVIKMPRGVVIGVVCQFSIMPIIGFTLAKVSGVPPEIAAGIILVGCSPSGLASNVMAYIAGANIALSVTLTAVATLLAPILTPFLMQLLADAYVPIDFLSMMISIAKIVILPVIAGLLLNHFFEKTITQIKGVFPLISMAGIVVIIAIITAAGRDSLLDIGFLLILVVITHNVSGFVLGYFLSRLSGLDQASSRTVAFEVGMQNSGLASGIALEMGKLATMGLAPAVFGPWMNISGSALAAFWKSKEPTV